MWNKKIHPQQPRLMKADPLRNERRVVEDVGQGVFWRDKDWDVGMREGGLRSRT